MVNSQYQLARKIIKSWGKSRSNFILIAPPLSFPEEYFYRELENSDLIRELLGPAAEQLAMAVLNGPDFKSESQFVDRVALQWGIEMQSGEIDPCSMLEEITYRVIRKGRKPLIVIKRFHEAIQRLGEEFGTKLRDLNHQYRLMSVVEIPVSLARLKDEWDRSPNPAPFLNSNWGQGQREICLGGFSRAEILERLHNVDGGAEKANFIFLATAGLAYLTEDLIDVASEKSLYGLEEYARSQSEELCRDLVRKVDIEGELVFQRLLARRLYVDQPSDIPTRISDHPWRDILEDEYGQPQCLMIYWACERALARKMCNEVLTPFCRYIEEEDHAGAIKCISSADGHVFGGGKPVQRILLEMVRFAESANPFDEKCYAAQRALKNLKEAVNVESTESLSTIIQKLEMWRPVIDMLCLFLDARENDPNLRIEEFVSENKNEGMVRSYLLYLQSRIQWANKMLPLSALKNTIEQPECLIQIYSHCVIGSRFWDFEGISLPEEQIKSAIGRPFKFPPKNARLGFQDMLNLLLVRGNDIPQGLQLWKAKSEMESLIEKYELRKRQVHSATPASSAEWTDYRDNCIRLLERVWAVVSKDETPSWLPNPDECIIDVLKLLGQQPFATRDSQRPQEISLAVL